MVTKKKSIHANLMAMYSPVYKLRSALNPNTVNFDLAEHMDSVMMTHYTTFLYFTLSRIMNQKSLSIEVRAILEGLFEDKQPISKDKLSVITSYIDNFGKFLALIDQSMIIKQLYSCNLDSLLYYYIHQDKPIMKWFAGVSIETLVDIHPALNGEDSYVANPRVS